MELMEIVAVFPGSLSEAATLVRWLTGWRELSKQH
jgi:hypothetical protein